jgi:hypothetical protein
MALHAQSILLDIGRFFAFLILYTVGRTPWAGDQPVPRPLPTHGTTQAQNKHTYIHALSGIRTHNSSVRASEYRAAAVIGAKYIGSDILNTKEGQTGFEWISFFFGLLIMFVADPCGNAVSRTRRMGPWVQMLLRIYTKYKT